MRRSKVVHSRAEWPGSIRRSGWWSSALFFTLWPTQPPNTPNTPNQSTFWPIMMPRLVYQTLFPMQNPRLSFKARFSDNNTITSFQDFFLTLRRWFGAADIHFHGLLHTGPLIWICVHMLWNCGIVLTKELRSLYGALLAEPQGKSGLSRTGVTLSLSGVATNKCAFACVSGRF